MKRTRALTTIVIVFTIVFGLGIVSRAKADDDVKECSNATLKGSYGFTSTGTILPPLFGQPSYSFDGPAGPFAEVGRQTFDGKEKGETEYTATINNNGEITTGLLFKGTYSVNKDCTGTMTLTQTMPFPSTVTFNFVIDDNGSEIRALLSGPIPAPTPCTASTCIVESRVYKKQWKPESAWIDHDGK
jgi:hypothetical protein